MTKTTKMTIIFASCFLVFLIAYLIVINPFANNEEYDPSTQVQYDPSVGEGTYLNKATMYDQYLQTDLTDITVKNDKGIYRFHKIQNMWFLYTFNYGNDMYEEKQADASSWTQNVLSSYKEQTLASLRVAVGVAYYQSKTTLDSSDEETFSLQLAQYGFGEDSSFYEFKAEKNGQTYEKRVYIGGYSDTLNNYYLRADGTDRVYVSASDLTCLFKGAEYYVTPQIALATESRANYYMNDFSIYRNSSFVFADEDDEAVKTVRRGDIVEIKYYIPGDGVSENDAIYSVIDTADESLPDSLINNLIGQKAGETKTFTVTYPASYGEKIYVTGNFSWSNFLYYNAVGEYSKIEGGASYRKDSYTQTSVVYTVTVSSIIRPEEEFIKINWLNQSQREPFYKHTTYTATGTARDYVVNTDNFFIIVDLFENMQGSEVVSLTLNKATIEQYGLDAYTVYYKMPKGIENENEGDSDINIMTYKYMENALFISEKQKDGTRYVGSWYYGTVIKVTDASTFRFLDWDFSEYIEDYIFKTEIKYMDSMRLEFNYKDKGPQVFEIKYRHTVDENDEDSYTTEVTINGRAVDTLNHAQLYTFIASIKYDGMCNDLSDTEAGELYNDASKCVLKMTFKLNRYAGEENNGKEFTYRICPYSTGQNPERHSLISSGDGLYFTVISSDIKKIYNDVQRLIAGENVDYNDRY